MTTLPTGTWDIDNAHTDVSFSVKHLMISKVKGSFSELSGTAVSSSDLDSSSVTATLKVDSVNTGDSGRDQHLKSSDFFDADSFPEITFVSTSVTESRKNDTFVVTGDLTIKGVTQTVDLDVEFTGSADDLYGNTKAAVEASTVISREDFGLTWNAALETGGVLVGDKITITIDAQLALRK